MGNVPDEQADDNAAKMMALMGMVGQVVERTAGHQAESLRTQSDANVRLAEIQAAHQLELAKLNSAAQLLTMKIGASAIAATLAGVVALVVFALAKDRPEIATHTITAAGSAVAGWLAGRAKR